MNHLKLKACLFYVKKLYAATNEVSKARDR
jgi:hypothetical protein